MTRDCEIFYTDKKSARKKSMELSELSSMVAVNYRSFSAVFIGNCTLEISQKKELSDLFFSLSLSLSLVPAGIVSFSSPRCKKRVIECTFRKSMELS